MRFKYLTATVLRNAAMRVEEENDPMCWALKNEFRIMDWIDGAREEFEKLLTEQGVSLDGWLWLETREERKDRKWDSDPELKAVRVLFLLMLADAVAYKSNGGKRKTSTEVKSEVSTDGWQDGNVKPEKPGVYEREFIALESPQFGYFDGSAWFYGSKTVEATLINYHEKKAVALYQNHRWKHIEQKPTNLVSFSVNPVEPGVYAVQNEHARGIVHYSKWNGEFWCLTDDLEGAKKHVEKSTGIYAKTPIYSGWYATRLDT